MRENLLASDVFFRKRQLYLDLPSLAFSSLLHNVFSLSTLSFWFWDNIWEGSNRSNSFLLWKKFSILWTTEMFSVLRTNTKNVPVWEQIQKMFACVRTNTKKWSYLRETIENNWEQMRNVNYSPLVMLGVITNLSFFIFLSRRLLFLLAGTWFILFFDSSFDSGWLPLKWYY